MKKSIITVVLVGLMLVMTAAVANAAIEPYYHGDFANDTTGCAKCHVTHAGSAKALLIFGTNQTQFCLWCHNDPLKSPYNVEQGQITTTTGFMPSVSGGFAVSYNFDDNAYDEVGGAVYGNYEGVTSVHGVEGFDNNDWLNGVQIPGGKAASDLSGDFRCGSCHDPHGGGLYTPGGNFMPRLLRDNLPAWGSAVAHTTYSDWTFSDQPAGDSWDGGTGQTQFKTRTTTGYGDNAGLWCAGCHDLFNRTEHDAGQHGVSDASGVSNRYMHRMNFTIQNDADSKTAIVNRNVYQIALSTGDKLTCLTCHRAHGTSVHVTNNAQWNRATTYKNSAGGNSSTATSTVLLREKNRDVCYDCHGAAEYNRPSQEDN